MSPGTFSCLLSSLFPPGNSSCSSSCAARFTLQSLINISLGVRVRACVRLCVCVCVCVRVFSYTIEFVRIVFALNELEVDLFVTPAL